ncbi:MAG: hypothetical protein ACRDLB_09640 [Actinomycetota bacterium]
MKEALDPSRQSPRGERANDEPSANWGNRAIIILLLGIPTAASMLIEILNR